MGQLTSIGGLGRMIGILIGGYLYDSGLGFRNGPLFLIASFVMFISTGLESVQYLLSKLFCIQ